VGLVTLNINKTKNNKFPSLKNSEKLEASASGPANHSPRGVAGAPVGDIKISGSSEYFFLSLFFGIRLILGRRISGSLGVVEFAEHESEKEEEVTKQQDTRVNLFKAKDAVSRVKTMAYVMVKFKISMSRY
jgi:hypothetical protein